jgi:hypothetical protein
MYCLGASTLAFISECIDRRGHYLKGCKKAWTHRPCAPASACPGDGLLAVLRGLRIDSRQAQAAATTPGTLDVALLAAEI